MIYNIIMHAVHVYILYYYLSIYYIIYIIYIHAHFTIYVYFMYIRMYQYCIYLLYIYTACMQCMGHLVINYQPSTCTYSQSMTSSGMHYILLVCNNTSIAVGILQCAPAYSNIFGCIVCIDISRRTHFNTYT